MNAYKYRDGDKLTVGSLSIRLALLALVLFVAVRGLMGKPVIKGDGREYIMQTQSIVLFNSLSVDPTVVGPYWNKCNPFDLELGDAVKPEFLVEQGKQAGGGFGGLYSDRFGSYRYYHFWLYSLVAAGPYALLHQLDPSGVWEYRSFGIVNTFFLMLPFLLCALQRRPTPFHVASAVVLLFAPLLPYTDWAHPELFCFGLVFTAFWTTIYRRALWLGPLLLGLAAMQYLPITLFFFPHLLLSLHGWTPKDKKGWLKRLASYAPGAIIALLPLLYYYHYFHTPSLIASLDLADLGNASFKRVLDLYISPLIGALWLFPAAMLLWIASLRKRNIIEALLLLLAMVGASWLATSTSNFNADQIGSVRYMVWMLAPLSFFALRPEWPPYQRGFRSSVYVLLFVAVLCGIFYSRLYRLPIKNTAGFGGTERCSVRTARLLRWMHYPEDQEVLLEHIRGEEVAWPHWVNGLHVWNLGAGQSVWSIPKTAFEQQDYNMNWSVDALPEYTTCPDNVPLFVVGESGGFTLNDAALLTFRSSPNIHPDIVVYMNKEIDLPDEISGIPARWPGGYTE